MKVFKYISAHYGLKTLYEQRLHVKKAAEFNDPFELSPIIECLSEADVRMILEKDEQIHVSYEIDGQRSGFASFEQYKQHYMNSLDARVIDRMKVIPEHSKCMERSGFAELFDGRWRLLCATTVPDSILMWSHYADNHKGVLLEIDTDNTVFREAEEQKLIVRVQYSDERSRFKHDPSSPEKFLDRILPIVGSKACEWRYESEVRFMYPLQLCDDGCYIRFRPAAIRSVSFGERTSKEDITHTINVLSEEEYLHVSIFRYFRSESAFKLESEVVRKGLSETNPNVPNMD